MAGEDLDLFGLPMVEVYRGRGRPAYVPTDRDRNRIKGMLALGWAIPRLANAIGVSPATVKRYFRAELRKRDQMRDQLEARRFELAWAQAEKGNVGAMREVARLIERNDLMLVEAEMGRRPKAGEASAPATDRPGKKIVDQQRAMDADADLMSELEREAAAANAHH